ncbi:MAG: alpha/beta fold hydrolase [Ornithinimicrobium sp.]
MTSSDSGATVFHDLEAFVDHPRLDGLVVSADGTRLVTTVSTRNDKHTAYVSALWEVDPAGHRPAHRLTRSTEGESGPAFGVNGDVYFTSKRPTDSAREDDAVQEQGLWLLPASGGEARLVLARPAGVTSVTCAADADLTVVSAPVIPGAADEDEHATAHRARTDAGVEAIVHQGYPVRFWDHDLSPEQPQLFTMTDEQEPVRMSTDPAVSLREQEADVSPDGAFVLTTAVVFEARAEQRTILLRIDTGTGECTRLIDEADHDVISATISPDSTRAIVSMSPKSTPHSAPRPSLWVVDAATGHRTPLATDWDLWSSPTAWLPDGNTVLAVADESGRGPVFAIAVATGEVRALTSDDATYSAVVVPAHGDASVAYAVRSSPAFPAEVVRIDTTSGEVTPLPGPVSRPMVPGRIEDVDTQAPDGTTVRGWLALPDSGNGPAPLLVFIHGGPLSSHNAWTWRWNPWVFVAQGYAVLLPDPALSTGYGQDFVQRGWGAWGGAPYTDLMALTDEVEQRADIDAERTAALGGSFGGYMANWIAGHTDRFDAIVTHASLWALDGFGPTTDAAFYWSREMTEQMALDNSPHRFVEHITTPMLVIHGDKDYRVPIGEGLRLWYELLSSSGLPAAPDGSTAHRFLYFPNENHWVLTPQHAKVWYEVVLAFLSEHVLATPPVPLPIVLGVDNGLS